MRVDSELLEHAQYGRELQAVALQFDDDYARKVFGLPGFDVVEAQVEVYGEPFGLGLVDERDARESVLDLLFERGCIVSEVLAKELAVAPELFVLLEEKDVVAGLSGVEALHRHALFLGAPVVVLGLHLEEVQVGVYVTAYAKLLPVGVSVVVDAEHLAVGRVKIGGIVFGNAQPIDLLHSVSFACKLKKACQHGRVGDELCVGTVHQFDAAHLLKRYRFVAVQYV